jgi:hypothetical protein
VAGLEVVAVLAVPLVVGGACGTTSGAVVVVVVVLLADGFGLLPQDASTPAPRRSPARSGAARLSREIRPDTLRCSHTAPYAARRGPVCRIDRRSRSFRWVAKYFGKEAGTRMDARNLRVKNGPPPHRRPRPP